MDESESHATCTGERAAGVGVGRNEMQKHQKRAKKRRCWWLALGAPGRDSLGLGLGPSGCFMGASIGRGKYGDTGNCQRRSREGLHRAREDPTTVESRLADVAVLRVSGCTAARPGPQAGMWVEMAAEIVLWLHVPLFQRPAWRGRCPPRVVFDLQQPIWCVHFTLGPDWPPKAPIALPPMSTSKPGALRACMHSC